MKYTNIKKILRGRVEKGIRTLWTHNETLNEFTCIYDNYNNGLTIYTPVQLLNKLELKNADPSKKQTEAVDT